MLSKSTPSDQEREATEALRDLEAQTLWAITYDPDLARGSILPLLRPEHFWFREHGRLYEFILTIAARDGVALGSVVTTEMPHDLLGVWIDVMVEAAGSQPWHGSTMAKRLRAIADKRRAAVSRSGDAVGGSTRVAL